MVTDRYQPPRSKNCAPSATAARHQNIQFSQPLLWHKRDPEANPRYKTQLCSHFMSTGHCPYGDSCVYAHGEHEKRDLTPHALAMRAQRQQRREREQREQEQRQRHALDSQDEARPSVCSPLASRPDTNPVGLLWSNPGLWSAPEPQTSKIGSADSKDADGDDNSCGIDLARMTSDLVATESDEPTQISTQDAKIKQLEALAHLYGTKMLTQKELTQKMIALLDGASTIQEGQLRSLAHLYATGCFTLDELKDKVSAIVSPASPTRAGAPSTNPANGLIGEMLSDPVEEPEEPLCSSWKVSPSSAKSEVFSSSDEDIKFGVDSEEDEISKFDRAIKMIDASDAQAELSDLLNASPALAGMVRYGRTLLMQAAKKGREGCVRELSQIMEAAQLDRRTKEKEPRTDGDSKKGGYTALHYAAYHGHRGVVEALLKAGSDATIMNAAGETPARTAGSNGAIASLLKAAASKMRKGKRNNKPSGTLAQGPAGLGFQSYRASKWSGSSDLGSDFARARDFPASTIGLESCL